MDALAQLALGGGGAGTGAVLRTHGVGAQALGAGAVLDRGGGVDAQNLQKTSLESQRRAGGRVVSRMLYYSTPSRWLGGSKE